MSTSVFFIHFFQLSATTYSKNEHHKPDRLVFILHFLQVSSPDRPHGTNASLIIGSEQLPLYSKKARNVYLFVRANTNQIKSEIICSLSNNGLIKLTHLSYPFKKCPASCSKRKTQLFHHAIFLLFFQMILYMFFSIPYIHQSQTHHVHTYNMLVHLNIKFS